MSIGRVLLIPMLVTLLGGTVSAQQAVEPQGKFVVVNDHRLWYRIAGQGSPLLLIPGGPGCSHSYFYPSMDRLANSFQVIYFDAFGRGQSDRAKNPRE
jgi:proline iminopeptidase